MAAVRKPAARTETNAYMPITDMATSQPTPGRHTRRTTPLWHSSGARLSSPAISVRVHTWSVTSAAPQALRLAPTGQAAARPGGRKTPEMSSNPEACSEVVWTLASGAAAEHALEQLDVLAEVPRPEEQVAYAGLRRRTHALGAVGVFQEPAHSLAEGPQVEGVHEVAGAAVLDLLSDAADARGHDRAALPHRLCDGEAEALRQALLGNDIGAPLKRVDDHGV